MPDESTGLAAAWFGHRHTAGTETLDWDLWIGPSPMRPYHPVFIRGTEVVVDFEPALLGIWPAVMDPIFWALKLKYPVSVQAVSLKSVWKMEALEHPKRIRPHRSYI